MNLWRWRAGIVICVVVAGGCAAQAKSTAASSAPRPFHSETAIYSQTKALAWLLARHRLAHSVVQSEFQNLTKPLPRPSGFIGHIQIVGDSPGMAPLPLQKGERIGTLDLFFFKSHMSAKAGMEMTLNYYVYGPLRYLSEKPPPRAKMSDWGYLAGNVIAVWQYPRQFRPAVEDAVLWRCLSASRV